MIGSLAPADPKSAMTTARTPATMAYASTSQRKDVLRSRTEPAPDLIVRTGGAVEHERAAGEALGGLRAIELARFDDLHRCRRPRLIVRVEGHPMDQRQVPRDLSSPWQIGREYRCADRTR